MSTPRGYNSYRGRSPMWKKAAAAALILVILLALAFMALQDRIFYDDSGTPQLPRPAQSSSSGGTSVDPGELNITIEEAAPKEEVLRIVQLAGVSEGAPDGTFNALAVTVKDAAGRVYDTADTEREALTALTAGEDRVIARLTCFLDPKAAKADVEGRGLKNTGGYLFYDGNNTNWLDPSKPAARQYLTGMAAELAALGVDELLLTEVSYPTVGKIDKINYGEALKPAALADFLGEMRLAVGEEMALSLELPAQTILEGSDPVAGIVLEDLAPLVDRVYAVTTAAEAPALEQAVKAACETTAFVPEVTDVTGLEGSWLLLS